MKRVTLIACERRCLGEVRNALKLATAYAAPGPTPAMLVGWVPATRQAQADYWRKVARDAFRMSRVYRGRRLALAAVAPPREPEPRRYLVRLTVNELERLRLRAKVAGLEPSELLARLVKGALAGEDQPVVRSRKGGRFVGRGKVA